ncbi:MAG: glycoside hydrolase family 25 protein [Ruminococcus sp.]|nr:glycoside hydrolase family 25 protein [Ruminococcus sp.]
MANFSKAKHAKGGFNFTPLLIIILVVVLVIVAVAVITAINRNNNEKPNSETLFVEQETEVIKKGEKISINDPSLGMIEIEAVEGFPKNTYNNDNFILDENGLMTYYLDENVASCMGVDLSEYQGEVDFDALKSQGFEYVILRIGGRYYGEEGKMYEDTKFFDYYKAATKAGLKVGAYFFSQAKNEIEGIEEANHVLSILGNVKLDYPIAFDWEHIEGDDARTDDVSGADLTAAALAFCNTIDEHGYSSIIYSNTYLMYYMYDLSQLKEIDFWIADYENKPSMYYNFTMWQYNIEGQVEGINGNVDLNICMKNY